MQNFIARITKGDPATSKTEMRRHIGDLGDNNEPDLMDQCWRMETPTIEKGITARIYLTSD